MSTAYVIRHLLFEDAGLLAPLLEERGCTLRVLEPGVDDLSPAGVLGGVLAEPLPDNPTCSPTDDATGSRTDDATDPTGPDLLVVLGGPVGVADAAEYPFLTEETALLRAWVGTGRPVLGICLGAQLLAEALGGAVRSTGRKEIGFGELQLTPAGEESVLAPLAGVPVLHWHGDEFLVPDGAELLASTPGFPNQAFSCGGPTGDRVLALQFHPEVDCALIERWLVGHAGELAAAGSDPRQIREDAVAAAPALSAAAREVFTAWLDRVGV